MGNKPLFFTDVDVSCRQAAFVVVMLVLVCRLCYTVHLYLFVPAILFIDTVAKKTQGGRA